MSEAGANAVTFEMRCSRSIEGEQQANDQGQSGRVVTLGTREFTLISTDEGGAPFEPHVQYATMSGTLLFPNGFDSSAFERIRRGRRVRVTVEVLDDEPSANASGAAAPVGVERSPSTVPPGAPASGA